MRRRKHLFVALSRTGWGETMLGLHVARKVREMGDDVTFLVHSGGVPALAGSGFLLREVPDHVGSLVPLILDGLVAEEAPSSIILCDFLTTNYTLMRFGVNPEHILSYEMPVIALDTWEYDCTGSVVDTFSSTDWNIGSWIERIEKRLVPVPIGKPTTSGGYCSLPDIKPVARSIRRHMRGNLGLRDGEYAALLCTAGWQHGIEDSDGKRLSTMVPKLLWDYLNRLGLVVRLIHVGPEPFSFGSDVSDERYQWLPALPPREFDRLLGSMDMFLSLNISATTIGRAMVLGIPVLAVRNSHRVTTMDDAMSLVSEPSAALRAWLSAAVPLFPFSMWPLGFSDFLKPLLSGNPYSSAIETVELLDEEGFVSRCRKLLSDSSRRDAVLTHQEKYVGSVRHLPTAAQLIDSYLM